MNFQYFTELADVETLWRSFQRDAVHTPFQDFDWLSCWVSTVGKDQGIQPLIACGSKNDKLVIILPLAIRRSLLTSSVTWLGHALSDYNAPLADPDYLTSLTSSDVARIWQDVLRQVSYVSHLVLSKQPMTIGGIANPFARYKAHNHTSKSHCVPLQGPWDEFYTNLRSGNTRRNLRRKEKNLAKQGELQFKPIRALPARRQMAEQILHWKSDQLRERGARNPFATEPVISFFGELAARPSAADLVKIYVMSLEDTVLAGAIILTGQDRFLLYQTVFLSGPHSRFSPGQILLRNLLKEAVDQDYKLFDFALGDEAYKFDWCQDHPALSSTAFAVKPSGHFWVLIERMRNRLIGTIKSSPFLFGLYTRMHRLLS